MKRSAYLVILMLAIVSLVACSSSNSSTPATPVFTVDGDGYNCTPQELIDYINETMTSEDFYEIPDYEASGEEIRISGSRLTLTITENSSQHVKRLRLYWYSGSDTDANTMSTAGYISGSLMNAFAPSSVDVLNTAVSNKQDIEFESAESIVEYESFGTDGNSLEITPLKE